MSTEFRCPRCNGWAFSFRPSTGLHYCNSDANGMHLSMTNEEFEEFTNTELSFRMTRGQEHDPHTTRNGNGPGQAGGRDGDAISLPAAHRFV